MTSGFITDTSRALRALRRAQRVRTRRQNQVQARFEHARMRLRRDLAAAAVPEGDAWRELLGVSGMTVGTAATLTDTSPATIRRILRGADHGD